VEGPDFIGGNMKCDYAEQVIVGNGVICSNCGETIYDEFIKSDCCPCCGSTETPESTL